MIRAGPNGPPAPGGDPPEPRPAARQRRQDPQLPPLPRPGDAPPGQPAAHAAAARAQLEELATPAWTPIRLPKPALRHRAYLRYLGRAAGPRGLRRPGQPVGDGLAAPARGRDRRRAGRVDRPHPERAAAISGRPVVVDTHNIEWARRPRDLVGRGRDAPAPAAAPPDGRRDRGLRAPRPARERPRVRVLGRRGGGAARRRHRPRRRGAQRRQPGGHPPRPRAARRRPRAVPRRPRLRAEHRRARAGSPTRSPRRSGGAASATAWWSPAATPRTSFGPTRRRGGRGAVPGGRHGRDARRGVRGPGAPVERRRHPAEDPRGLRRRPRRGLDDARRRGHRGRARPPPADRRHRRRTSPTRWPACCATPPAAGRWPPRRAGWPRSATAGPRSAPAWPTTSRRWSREVTRASGDRAPGGRRSRPASSPRTRRSACPARWPRSCSVTRSS